MFKHNAIIAALLLVTAAACQQDKASTTAPANTPTVPSTGTPPTPGTGMPAGTANGATGTPTSAAATGDNTAGSPGDAAPQTEHEVQAASLAVSRARGDFLAVADVRLNELDKKLELMKKDKKIKKGWATIDRLRADTEALRAAIKSNARLYTLEVQKEFEALVGTIDERLR